MKTEGISEAATRLLTVKQFAKKPNEGWPTESALRAIILDASWGKKGFQTAFKRVGRRVLVDEVEFWRCVNRLQGANHDSLKQ